MRSTFFGLETARRGMFTQQTALYTTGHNISNANTPGYTRQRINFETTLPYPSPGLNRPMIPGQMGTGVKAGTIQRIRDSFVDTQYRMESNKFGHFSTLNQALSKMEDIMNEPTNSGLHAVMEKFWNSLQDLAAHTENSGARDVVAANGQMVADTLNYYFNSLTRVQEDLGNEIIVKEKEINKLTEQIARLNKQISEIEPQGYIPNDLYDERDRLVDQLSGLVNIKVSKHKPNNYGNAKEIAEGKYHIEIVKKDNTSYTPPIFLVEDAGANALTVTDNDDHSPRDDEDQLSGPVTGLTIDGQTISGSDIVGTLGLSGSLSALIESYGYMGGGEEKGYYPDMIDKLNKMTETFAKEFNRVHGEGYTLVKDANGEAIKGEAFFVFDPDPPTNFAQAIKVNENIVKNPNLIAAAEGEEGNTGDNKNAQNLADIKGKDFSEYLSGNPHGLAGNVNTYYSGITGKLGVDAQSVKKDATNSLVLLDSVHYERQSISAVSLDEEMINMIKFQHAYNAGARNITVIDEMLDKIINGMGVVGR